MPMTHSYPPNEPTRAELDRTEGVLIVEFGAPWCGICKAAQPSIEAALRAHPELRHIKVSDGKGLPLGRTDGVKLWPTLIGLRDGREIARVVRPPSQEAISQLLAATMAGS
ncbi:MAG: thioredoxin family protein [Polyangiales bacterium]